MPPRRRRLALVFAIDALPDSLHPAKRRPKQLAGKTCYVYWPGNELPIVLPGCRTGATSPQTLEWLRAMMSKLPKPAIAGLMKGHAAVSAWHLTARVDQRTPATVGKQLAARGFEVVDLDGLLDLEPPPARHALVLQVSGLGGAAGTHDIHWVARDRASLCEMAEWLINPDSYGRGALSWVVQTECWSLHIVKAGEIARSFDLLEHLRLDGKRVHDWLAGDAERPRRVSLDWAAMKLPRASARSVGPGEELLVSGWDAHEAAIRLRFGINNPED
jgi:hypothetical protein